MNEILLFIILFLIGVVCSIVFGIIRLLKYDSAHVSNEKINAAADEYKYEESADDIESNNVKL